MKRTDHPPGREPHRIWAGQGTGAICSRCGRPIEPHQIEYEVELPGSGDTLRFHYACQQAWEDSL